MTEEKELLEKVAQLEDTLDKVQTSLAQAMRKIDMLTANLSAFADILADDMIEQHGAALEEQQQAAPENAPGPMFN